MDLHMVAFLVPAGIIVSFSEESLPACAQKRKRKKKQVLLMPKLSWQEFKALALSGMTSLSSLLYAPASACVSRRASSLSSHASSFAALYIVTSIYFSGVMVCLVTIDPTVSL